MKQCSRGFYRALSAALALSLCLSGAGAAWYGRDIQRQENGNYVLYEPYSDKNIIETPYHLYELTYIGSADGMAGVHTAARFSSGTQAVETSFPTAASAPPVLSATADTWLYRMCRTVYTASGR